MNEVLFAIEVPKTFNVGLIVGYLVGGFVTCIIFLWLSVSSKLRGYMSTETLIKLILAFMIVIFVEASVILGGIILECVR